MFNTDNFKQSNLTNYELYSEVWEVLEVLQNKATLGVFSEGNIDFQNEKLLQTKIKEFFAREHTHIVLSKSDSLGHVLKKYQSVDVILVDDKLMVLSAAKKYLPTLTTVWIKRGMYAENQKPIAGFSPDYIIETLDEILEIVS